MPVAIPKGVEIKAEADRVRVKGPKGELVSAIPYSDGIVMCRYRAR